MTRCRTIARNSLLLLPSIQNESHKALYAKTVHKSFSLFSLFSKFYRKLFFRESINDAIDCFQFLKKHEMRKLCLEKLRNLTLALNLNQSRICGKGVGLSLFPSDSLSFESYEQFVRKSKKSKNDCFFWPFLG